MSNSLLTISTITKESLRQLKNNLVFTKGINRNYDDSFAIKGAKIGSVVNIRKPVRFTVTDGAALNLQDVTDQSVALTIDQQKHVGFQFSSKDMTLSIDEFSDRYIKPACTALANKVDLDGLALGKDVFNAVGTPGTTPATLLVFLQAMQKLAESGAPMDDMFTMIVNPAAQASVVDALKGLFQSTPEIKKQYERGVMGTAAGFDWKMAQNIYTHTVGPLGGTPLVNGVPASGAVTLVTDGWTAVAAARLKKGDTFTIANVNAVNPQTRQSTGALQRFVVTADVSSDGSGNLTAAISPAITSSGQYQTVDALPVDNAAITVLGAASTLSPINLAYHRDAFAMACVDLELPGGVEMAARASDADSGLSIRLVRAYDINNDTHPCRLDIMYGLKTIYPELACRVHG